MKGIMKVLTRCILAMAGIVVFMLLLNVGVLISWTAANMENSQPKKMARATAEGLVYQEDRFVFEPQMQNELQRERIWAMLVDQEGRVTWEFELPAELPRAYSPFQIAQFSRFYLQDYPAYVWEHPQGMVVVGYPKNSIWRYQVQVDTKILDHVPFWGTLVLCVNVSLAVLLSLLAGLLLLRSMRPLAGGIRLLAEGEPVKIKEEGILSDVAESINRTSKALQEKDQRLQKRDTARANWISGVSHDIRTPLSVILGYAGQLSDDGALPKEARQSAQAIVRQGMQLRELINNLNLVSKLEYDMKSVERQPLRPTELLREVVSDILNDGQEGNCEFFLDYVPSVENRTIEGDAQLLRRAVRNLIQNSIKHNPKGCAIRVGLEYNLRFCKISVTDNGKGMDEKKLAELKSRPHYIYCDRIIPEQRHGMGLLIVQYIVRAHGGCCLFFSKEGEGFQAVIKLPVRQ